MSWKTPVPQSVGWPPAQPPQCAACHLHQPPQSCRSVHTMSKKLVADQIGTAPIMMSTLCMLSYLCLCKCVVQHMQAWQMRLWLADCCLQQTYAAQQVVTRVVQHMQAWRRNNGKMFSSQTEAGLQIVCKILQAACQHSKYLAVRRLLWQPLLASDCSPQNSI